MLESIFAKGFSNASGNLCTAKLAAKDKLQFIKLTWRKAFLETFKLLNWLDWLEIKQIDGLALE